MTKTTIVSSYFELFGFPKTTNVVQSNLLLNTYENLTYTGSRKIRIPGSQIVIEKDYVYCIKPKNPQCFYFLCPVYGMEKMITVDKATVEALRARSIAFSGDIKQEFEELKRLNIKNSSPTKRKVVLMFTIDLKEKDKGMDKFFDARGFKKQDILKRENGAYRFCYLYYKLIDTQDIKAELGLVKKVSRDLRAKFKGIRIIVECVYDIVSRSTSPKRFLNSSMSRIDKKITLSPISLVKNYKLW